MNSGPTKKQKSNSGEPVATYGPTWLNTKDAIAMAAGLPVDIFFDLLKKLSFKNMSVYLIEMIRQHPEPLKNKLISPAAKDTWKNLLIELNKMDPSIIVEAPAGHENDALWHFRSVMQASHAIYQRQNEEIAHLKRKHPNHKQWLVIDTQDISANEVTLEFLMTRHQQLDAFNESIIVSKIDLQSNRLNLSNSGITRIPEALFHDESLATYWRNVVEFECTDTIICHLPNSIGNLSSLRTLICENNELQQLPDSIGNLLALVVLNCSVNRLQQLPDTLGNLVALDCSDNRLQQLPDSIGNLAELQELYCGSNQLQQLPDSISNLVALQSLYCTDNQLQCLPDNLREKFGKNWFERTLATQAHPALQPPFLPAYAAVVAQTQQGEKRTERPTETLDAEKEANNTDALKRHKP